MRILIELKLDVILAENKMTLTQLSEKLNMSNVNLSNIKNGKIKGMRFTTLNELCKSLHCQPGDILKYTED